MIFTATFDAAGIKNVSSRIPITIRICCCRISLGWRSEAKALLTLSSLIGVFF